MTIEFLITTLIVVVSPGTGVLYTLAAGLSRGSRAANVKTAFHASPGVDGQSILLVDDICTTGETLRACARELVRAGAMRVCAITVAKAV